MILAGFTLFCCLSACSEPPPAVSPGTSQSELEKPASKPLPEARKNLEWPFISDESETDLILSKNLTTKNFALVFDGSGSMAEAGCSAGRRKIDVAKEAVTEWARTLPGDANLGLVAFYYNEWAEMELSSGKKDHFSSLVNGVKAGGKTPLTEAITKAYISLTETGKKQLGYGEYTIVVVTDGIANNRAALSASVKKILRESPVSIYTIGFCIGNNHSLNQPGKTVYKAADNPEELKKGLSDVLAESEKFDEAEFIQ